MADTIKCACSKCGAKYRLPVEAQGRTARCKRCGEKFQIPRVESLEDSILTWLSAPDETETEQAMPAKPRVISMPTHAEASGEAAADAAKRRGPIRMKSSGSTAKTESA